MEEVQQLGFEQVVLTNVQFPKLSKKQDYGTTNGVSRADQLKADIAALQDRFSGKVTCGSATRWISARTAVWRWTCRP